MCITCNGVKFNLLCEVFCVLEIRTFYVYPELLVSLIMPQEKAAYKADLKSLPSKRPCVIQLHRLTKNGARKDMAPFNRKKSFGGDREERESKARQ